MNRIKTGKIIKCACCGKEKYYPPSVLMRRSCKYCSQSCASKLGSNGFKTGHIDLVSVEVRRSENMRIKISIALSGENNFWYGKTFSKTHRAKIGKSHKGDKNHNWKGGITNENEKIRKSPEYKEWRTSVFERDNFTCVKCNRRGCKLHADHIKPFSLYAKLRLDVDNGRTLCESCHRETFTYAKAWKSKDEFDVSYLYYLLNEIFYNEIH